MGKTNQPNYRKNFFATKIKPFAWQFFADSASPREKRASVRRSDFAFVLASFRLGAFLDEKLSILGLSAKEAQDFAEFWIPELLRHRKDGVRGSVLAS